jgi:hypothetical protein
METQHLALLRLLHTSLKEPESAGDALDALPSLPQADVNRVIRETFAKRLKAFGALGEANFAFDFDSYLHSQAPAHATYVLVADMGKRASEDAQAERIKTLERERDELLVKSQLLESRVQEERRTASRAVQAHDQLLKEFQSLQETNKGLLDALHGQRAINDCMANAVLGERQGCPLVMVEQVEGVVKSVSRDAFVVVYELEDDFVEQTYSRKAFSGKGLPEINSSVRLSVYMTTVPREKPSNPSQGVDPRRERANSFGDSPIQL